MSSSKFDSVTLMLLSVAIYSIPEPEEASYALKAADWDVCGLAVTGNRLVSACKTVFSRLKSPSDSLLLTKLRFFKLSSVSVCTEPLPLSTT